jgi:hypothetical protein
VYTCVLVDLYLSEKLKGRDPGVEGKYNIKMDLKEI